MRRISIYLEESILRRLERICSDEGYDSIDECVAWAIQEMLKIFNVWYHTGSISSSISSDNPNHPTS